MCDTLARPDLLSDPAPLRAEWCCACVRPCLQTVATPLLCMSAKDDPIIDPKLLRHAEEAASTNPNVSRLDNNALHLRERGSIVAQ